MRHLAAFGLPLRSSTRTDQIGAGISCVRAPVRILRYLCLADARTNDGMESGVRIAGGVRWNEPKSEASDGI